jgi:hypothetical protein
MKLLATALVKAQKEFEPARKDATNPHFRSKYANLSACVDAVKDALNNNGISLIQNTHESDNGVIVETIFLHESGEMLSAGKLHFPASKQDAQGYMSALTYARRGQLLAACGIAPEDDDGNAAVKSMPSAKQVDKPIVKPKEEIKLIELQVPEGMDILEFAEKSFDMSETMSELKQFFSQLYTFTKKQPETQVIITNLYNSRKAELEKK